MSTVLSETMSSEVQSLGPLLTDEMLARFHERAPIYDRENRFFSEDFEELRQAGYLAMPVPLVLGGLGMNLAEVCHQQRRLAIMPLLLRWHSICTSTGSAWLLIYGEGATNP